MLGRNPANALSGTGVAPFLWGNPNLQSYAASIRSRTSTSERATNFR